ncbi:MAG: nicotinate (nicotinamide) nucleotide adenylyltransferase [Mariprofundaceae bacterium]
MSNKPVGIFGGSFDPPHLGHVELVLTALKVLDLGEVWILPAGIPVHKSLSGKADAIKRLHWLENIFAGQKHVKILDWEVIRAEPTPTILSLRRFRTEHPDTWAVLLLGEDAYAGMKSWVDYPEHCQLVDIAVFSRAGFTIESNVALPEWHQTTIEAWRQIPGCGRCIRVNESLPDVSATDIRRKSEKGLSLQHAVSEHIRTDIEKIYGSGKMEKTK